MVINTPVKARTKEALLDAFWELYRVTPIDRITVGAVTRRAGFNRSTFYEYFSDLYQVLDEIESQLLTQIEQAFRAGAGHDFDKWSKQSAALFLANGERLSVLLGKNGDPDFPARVKDTMRPAIRGVFGLPADDIRASYALEFILSGNLAVLARWNESNHDLSLDELIALLQSLIAFGPFAILQDTGHPAGAR